MVSRILRHRLLLASIFIGWICVSITPVFDSVRVTAEYALTKHRIGFPLPIIEQHTSLTPMDDAYPFHLGLLSPQETPTTLLLGNYVLQFVIAVLGVYVILIAIKYLLKELR
ncbi:hypothetical protein M3204_17355 [Mesobacillus subterraneus]|uniref:hypothetical protein n=1 Tax=Mesobacillus subterraneus TaxID=285983 RepID=UPI0020410472|nr:hypothetical protein [Mesobacillus subterraneus]MCM3666189.1 hypothetical protein [Mesobacillus subterraneus]MCM3685187.1 hypothetical protein [Mesobacillus subterraneus]